MRSEMTVVNTAVESSTQMQSNLQELNDLMKKSEFEISMNTLKDTIQSERKVTNGHLSAIESKVDKCTNQINDKISNLKSIMLQDKKTSSSPPSSSSSGDKNLLNSLKDSLNSQRKASNQRLSSIEFKVDKSTNDMNVGLDRLKTLVGEKNDTLQPSSAPVIGDTTTASELRSLCSQFTKMEQTLSTMELKFDQSIQETNTKLVNMALKLEQMMKFFSTTMAANNNLNNSFSSKIDEMMNKSTNNASTSTHRFTNDMNSSSLQNNVHSILQNRGTRTSLLDDHPIVQLYQNVLGMMVAFMVGIFACFWFSYSFKSSN